MVRAWRDQPTPGRGTDLMWTPSGVRIVGTSPLRVACRFCRTPRGQQCSKVVPRRGRISVATHGIRIQDAIDEAAHDPTDTTAAVETPGDDPEERAWPEPYWR